MFFIWWHSGEDFPTDQHLEENRIRLEEQEEEMRETEHIIKEKPYPFEYILITEVYNPPEYIPTNR